MKRVLSLTILALFAAMGYAADKPPPKFLAAQAKPEHHQLVNEKIAAKATYPIKAKGRKLLLWSRAMGFPHSSIPIGGYVMMQMGKATEVYEAVESLDLREFEPANLKKYDGIILNNTTGSWLSPNPEKYPDDAALISKYGDAKKASQALLQSLLAFVEDGGAIIGYHSATDANKGTAFVPLIGGLFDGHPWGSGDTVNVKIDDPANPLLKAFGDKADFDITDEIYQFQQYDRGNVRVLMSLNVAKTNMDKKGIKRTDGDFPISWVRTQGKGRVFYCSLGHREDIFWNPVVMQYYLDGIQWALGDTDVPTESLPLKTADMGLDGDCPGCVHAPLANAAAKAAAE